MRKKFSGGYMKYLFAGLTAFTSVLATQQLSAKADFVSKYEVIPLVSNTGTEEEQDSNLINPWGLFVDKKGIIYAADNGTNLITSYDKKGSPNTFIVHANSAPTGLEENDNDHSFIIPGTHVSARFLLCTEEGTILAYNGAANHGNAIIVADRSSIGAVYKGLALAEDDGEDFIYAADFYNATVDVFDSRFNYVKSFTDPTVPVGFAPFNVQKVHHHLYVTFAKQGIDPRDDEPGFGNGYVDIFKFDGSLDRRVISNGALNSPWGIAMSTRHFGKYSHALLVGNFGDGTINAFNADTGIYIGTLNDKYGNRIQIDGLWSIMFKSHETGHLHFSAGPNGETGGLIGFIESVD